MYLTGVEYVCVFIRFTVGVLMVVKIIYIFQ